MFSRFFRSKRAFQFLEDIPLHLRLNIVAAALEDAMFKDMNEIQDAATVEKLFRENLGLTIADACRCLSLDICTFVETCYNFVAPDENHPYEAVQREFKLKTKSAPNKYYYRSSKDLCESKATDTHDLCNPLVDRSTNTEYQKMVPISSEIPNIKPKKVQSSAHTKFTNVQPTKQKKMNFQPKKLSQKKRNQAKQASETAITSHHNTVSQNRETAQVLPGKITNFVNLDTVNAEIAAKWTHFLNVSGITTDSAKKAANLNKWYKFASSGTCTNFKGAVRYNLCLVKSVEQKYYRLSPSQQRLIARLQYQVPNFTHAILFFRLMNNLLNDFSRKNISVVRENYGDIVEAILKNTSYFSELSEALLSYDVMKAHGFIFTDRSKNLQINSEILDVPLVVLKPGLSSALMHLLLYRGPTLLVDIENEFVVCRDKSVILDEINRNRELYIVYSELPKKYETFKSYYMHTGGQRTERKSLMVTASPYLHPSLIVYNCDLSSPLYETKHLS